MRIALLSTLDRDPRPGRIRPAYMQFAGARIIERQLDLALAMGCRSVACLVEGIGREVIELQHRAERGGARFIAVREHTQLSGMVTAMDEILVIAAGVLPEDAAVERLVAKQSVIAFPADVAVPAGFERIDAEFAWGGVMLARGSLIERLAELPPDIDVSSSLMRLALQTGSPLAPAERRLIDDGDWTIDAPRETLLAREARWIEAQREAVPFTAPGIAVAERVGARLARDIVGSRREIWPTIVAGMLLLLAAGVTLAERPALGLVLATAGAFFGRIGSVVERVAGKGQRSPPRGRILRAVDFLIDPLFIFLIFMASPQQPQLMRVFVPVVLFGLLRLGELHGSERWRLSYADRILLGCLLVPASFLGFAAQAAALVALAVLASRFFKPFRAD